MKTRELTQSELEMLGLQEGTIATATTEINNADLQKYVGQFISHKGHLGMVDEVHGNRLGFVWSDKDSWTGQLIDVQDVKDIQVGERDKAKHSAQIYFNREATSLRSRIARNYAFDNKATLNTLLTHCETWLRKLGA